MRDRRLWTAVAIAALGAVGVALPYVVSSFIINVLALAMTYALLALGINLLGGYAGLASLGHGGIMAMGAYALAIMALRTDAGSLVQALVGVGFGVLAGAAFGLLSMRTSGVYFLMATLAGGMIVWGLTLTLPTITGGENGLRGLERPPLFEPYWALYYLALAVLALGLLVLWLITRSPFGLALRGVQNSEPRMRMLGFNPAVLKVYAFTLSGLFAGASGVLFAYYNRFVSPGAAGFLTSGKVVLMVILGGVGTLAGPVIGAVIITFVENVLSTYTARWPTALGLLYIAAVLFAREGIAGLGARLLGRPVPRAAADATAALARTGVSDAEPGAAPLPVNDRHPVRTPARPEPAPRGDKHEGPQ